MTRARGARYASQIPNALTVLRLAVAASFPFSPAGWRLGLVIVGGVSDGLDGFLARRLHVVSWLGALMDGIADKLFTLSVLLTITLDGVLGWPAFAGLLARDVVNALIAAYVGGVGRWDLFTKVSARPSGKVTTAAIFGMLMVLLWRPAVGQPLVWVAMAASISAALDYAVVFVRWAVLKIEPGDSPPEST